jgi:hypothetical protein
MASRSVQTPRGYRSPTGATLVVVMLSPKKEHRQSRLGFSKD